MEIDLKQLQEIIPFKWRVQSTYDDNKGGGTCKMIAYVDSRDVQTKLDDVCGIGNWQSKFYDVKGTLFCSIGILINGEWVWKSDAGSKSRVEAEKGEASDAFKRAGVQWGINRDAYKVEILSIKGRKYNNKIYPVGEDGKFLKGKELNDYCNSLAKIDEMENYMIEPTVTTEETLL